MRYYKIDFEKIGKISLKIAAASLLLGLASCEEALVEKPKFIVVENFFNTSDEVEAAVNAIYSPLRATNYTVYETSLECQADYAYGRGSWAPLHEQQGLNDANISRVQGLWNNFYLSIRNANLVIRNAPNGTSISQEDIAKHVGEAKFMRAFNYFQLVRNWAGVPLRTEENMTENDLRKSTPEEVYALIEADLKEAEMNLPDRAANVGRPTRWAAKTMLAEVLLTLGRYEEAKTKADEVIKSNRFSLVPVQSVQDFQTDVFGPELVSTTEEIFYLKYTRQVNQGNYMLWITNHPSTNLFNFGGAYVVYGFTTEPFYKNWPEGDLRKDLWQKVNIGLGPNTLISAKFADNQAISQQGAGNDDPVYGYNDALLLFAEAATRAANAPTAEALEALNQVHRRAYGQLPGSPSEVDYELADYTTETFLDLIIQERAYEFLYLGKRWLDLKRINKVKEFVKKNKGVDVADKHLLWPIPVSELNFNRALNPATDQNPGY
ncbi:RagB/SusD family nutrient uptake outer membrane protein [Arundinibacter roseus]|uniref:RagB/SusD family nutrient uptake outer membrane protein n=1 Tax=Arundinibacter roseus TaxID=2070510 RepID=A0A4R4K4G5_9BACT|nr:RagB/SusD family nutrient uptake outer membrane protein [Arundinibacter roseus]TDB62334.1 RagB/SusD family nutrient uptake outer membrane protein [Arundinibacter roseus]